MNERQYNIVKIFQALHVSARRFAVACKVPYAEMRQAYTAGTWSQYRDTLGFGFDKKSTDEMREEMGL